MAQADDEDFYEEDESAERIWAIFDAGDKGVTSYPEDETDLTSAQMDAIMAGAEEVHLGDE